MGKSPDEQPFLAAYKLRLAKLTLVPITRQLLDNSRKVEALGELGSSEAQKVQFDNPR